MTTKVSLIDDSSVTGAAIKNLTITTDDIANNAVTTSKIDFGTALVPLGAILMWSGVTAPSGYQLCNNSELPSNSPLRPLGVTNTPNLQDRFIVGAGSGYAVGATAGSADATLVSHTHSGSADAIANHAHGGVTVRTGIRTLGGIVDDGSGSYRYVSLNNGNTGGAGAHGHTLTINAEGSSATNANLPPYYALAFIMRVL